MSLQHYNEEEIKLDIMSDIEAHVEWSDEVRQGKMFGFLVCEDGSGTPVILKAYSGQILGRSDWPGYVPAIFDYLQPDGYFKMHEGEITALNHRFENLKAELAGRRTAELDLLRKERKERSNALQRWLFSQFMLRGAHGEERSVLQVFTDYAGTNGLKQQYPPGGTGECCAPKLLHYANSHGLRPVMLREFWYGESPRGEVRHHGLFYEPCQAKCMPILWFLDNRYGQADSPTGTAAAIAEADIIYEDKWLIAINKPAGLLSVPGKRRLPNAEDMLHDLRPKCSFLKMVHRLDMDTSGVLVAAKTEEAYKDMQRLFAQHDEVRKEYIAVVCADGGNTVTAGQEGRVSLPLSADFLNRPRQMVDHEHGKEAITEYEVLSDDGDTMRLWLSPLTGRTHQLRMHCAHADGLAMPILGDPLYGSRKAERMYLHAERLSFVHPATGEQQTLVSHCPF